MFGNFTDPLIDAPWWGRLLLALVVVTSWFLLRLTRLLMPTTSSDRLKWWLAVLELGLIRFDGHPG
ncbi:hypothetical protein [Embleya sp. AB8]|uniref:hypothetical protein n=1 Tax=Embleya sp. AB8 TaxID=3156304 RepID=UPI003C759F8E